MSPKIFPAHKFFLSIIYLSKHFCCLQTWISVLNLVLKLLPMLFLWCPRHLLRTLGLTLKMWSLLLRYTFFKTYTHFFILSFTKKGVKSEEFYVWPLSCHLDVQGEHDQGNVVGLNQHTGEPIDPQMEGIFDNYSVKRQIINSGYVGTYNLNFNTVLFLCSFCNILFSLLLVLNLVEEMI